MQGWVKGYCVSEVKQTATEYLKENLTQAECEDYCKNIQGSTGCQYNWFLTNWCDAYKYPLHALSDAKDDKKITYRCLIFEKNNKAARNRPNKNIHGKLTRPYKTNPHQLY